MAKHGANVFNVEVHSYDEAVGVIVELADQYNIGVAWVDRTDVELHAERDLTDEEFRKLDLSGYDEYICNQDDVQTEFITDVLNEAGIES